MSKEKDKIIADLQAQNAELSQELEDVKNEIRRGKMNPAYKELVDFMAEGPKTFTQMSDFTMQDHRTISQWMYQLKSRWGAEIITLSDGRKELRNAQQVLLKAGFK